MNTGNFILKIEIYMIPKRDKLKFKNIFTARMAEWLQFNKFKMTIKDALIKLNDLVDESDPDTSLPNIVHAFQTAESIRKTHPDLDWFHLTGLIHDLGKVKYFSY